RGSIVALSYLGILIRREAHPEGVMLRSPISWCAVMLMRACLPITICPGVVAERRGVLELCLRYSGAITAESRVVFECGPRNGIMAVRQTQKPPKLMTA